jgi:hypothetical protein
VRFLLDEDAYACPNDERAFSSTERESAPFAAHAHLVQVGAGLEDEVIFESPEVTLLDLHIDARIKLVISDEMVTANVRTPLRWVVPAEVVVAAWKLFLACDDHAVGGVLEREGDACTFDALFVASWLPEVEAIRLGCGSLFLRTSCMTKASRVQYIVMPPRRATNSARSSN